jgi:hypothetical protein
MSSCLTFVWGPFIIASHKRRICVRRPHHEAFHKPELETMAFGWPRRRRIAIPLRTGPVLRREGGDLKHSMRSWGALHASGRDLSVIQTDADRSIIYTLSEENSHACL